jgi:hypothetical protein
MSVISNPLGFEQGEGDVTVGVRLESVRDGVSLERGFVYKTSSIGVLEEAQRHEAFAIIPIQFTEYTSTPVTHVELVLGGKAGCAWNERLQPLAEVGYVLLEKPRARSYAPTCECGSC